MGPGAVSVVKGKVWPKIYTLKMSGALTKQQSFNEICKPNDEAKVRAVCRKKILIEEILLFQTSVFTPELFSMNEVIGLQG